MNQYFYKIFLFLFLSAGALAQSTHPHRISQVLVRGNTVAANVAPYAKIQVCVANTSCNTLASVYADYGLTEPLDQPISADASGNYDYYFEAGCVDEQISAPGQGTKTIYNVCLENGSSANILAADQYRLFQQPLAGSQTIAGPSNIYTDATGNNLYVPGQTTLGDGALAISRNYAPASITQFGAKCDGVTDDSTAINAAIASESNIIAPPKSTCVVASYLEYVKASSIAYLKFDLNGSTLLFTGDGGGACSRMTNGLIQVHPSEGNGIHITNGTLSATNSNAGCVINFSQTSANSGDGYSHNIWLDYLTFTGTNDGPTAYGTNNLIGIWTYYSGELRIEHNTFMTYGTNAIQLGGLLSYNQSDIINVSHNNFQGTYRHAPQIIVDSPQAVSIENNNFEVSGILQTGSSPANSSIRDNWVGDGSPGIIEGTASTVSRTNNVTTLTQTYLTRLRVGDTVVVSGSTDSTMDGTYTVTAVPTPVSFSYANTGSDVSTTSDAPTWYASVSNLTAIDIGAGSSDISSNFIYSQRGHGLTTGISISGGDAFTINANTVTSYGIGIYVGNGSSLTASGSIASNKVQGATTNYISNISAVTFSGNTCSNGTTCLSVTGGSGSVYNTFRSFATTYATCASGVSGNNFIVNSGTISTCSASNNVIVAKGQSYMPGSLSIGGGGLLSSTDKIQISGRINPALQIWSQTTTFTPTLAIQSAEVNCINNTANDYGHCITSAGGASNLSTRWTSDLSGNDGWYLWSGATKSFKIDNAGLHFLNQTIPASSTATCTAGTSLDGVDSGVGYHYFCTAANTWVRIAMATW